MAQIKGNLQNETIALLLASTQLVGHQESSNQNRPKKEDRTDDQVRDDEYMNIMEWIAQCFVLEKFGDVAAVASELIPGTAPAAASAAPRPGTASVPTKMNFAAAAASAPKTKGVAAPVVASPAKIKLLVTNNKGKNPTPQNKAFGEAFVKVLNKKLQTFYIGNSNEANLTNAVDDLMLVVVKHGWPRVASKISKVKEAFPMDRADSVGRVLDLWKERGLLKEEDFVEQATSGEKKKLPEQRIADLKNHVRTFLNDPLAAALDTPDKRLTLLRNMCNSCKHLLQAIDGVVKRSPPGIPMPDKITLKSIMKLRRRLWRVLRYSAGPQLFLTKGITTLKYKIRMAGGNHNSIEFLEPEWVATNTLIKELFSAAPQPITVTKDTFIDWFKDEFRNAGNNEKRTKAIETISRFCNSSGFKNTWRPSLHCEVALLAYLYMTNKTIISNAIGVSKLNCFACSVYTDQLNKASSGVYKMSGTSGKTHHQWLIPNSAVFASKPALFNEVSGSGKEVVKMNARDTIMDFLKSTGGRTSTGSDSSTGSGGMDASAVALLPEVTSH